MSQNARSLFLKFINIYGFEIYKDSQKFNLLIRDFFENEYTCERDVLISSVREGIPERLLEKKEVITYPILQSECIEHIAPQGFNPDLCRWAVDSWAIAFNIIENVNPQEAACSINFSTLPPGGVVYLDGILRGNAPLHLYEVSAGTHTLRCTYNDHQDWYDTFNLEPGEQSDITAVLIPNHLQQNNPANKPFPNPTPIPTPESSKHPPPTTPPIAPLQLRNYGILAVLLIIGVLLIGILSTGNSFLNKMEPASSIPVSTSITQNNQKTLQEIQSPTQNNQKTLQEIQSPTQNSAHVDFKETSSYSFEPMRQNAPLKISLIINPEMVTDQKTAFSGSNDRGTTYKKTQPDHMSQVSITVKKKNDGSIIQSETFANFASAEEFREMTIYSDGPYNIIAAGKMAEVSIKTY